MNNKLDGEGYLDIETRNKALGAVILGPKITIEDLGGILRSYDDPDACGVITVRLVNGRVRAKIHLEKK